MSWCFQRTVSVVKKKKKKSKHFFAPTAQRWREALSCGVACGRMRSPPCCLHADTWQNLPCRTLYIHQSVYLFIKDLTKNKATLRKHFLPTLFWLSCNLSRCVKLHLTGVYFSPDYPTQPPATAPCPTPCRRQSHEGNWRAAPAAAAVSWVTKTLLSNTVRKNQLSTLKGAFPAVL